MKTFLRDMKTAALFLVLFEVFSLYGFIYPEFSTAAFMIVLAVTAIIAMKRIELATLVLFGELFVGSQGGYMLSFDPGVGLNLSIRIGLFLVVFGIWASRNIYAYVFGSRSMRSRTFAWYRTMKESGLLVPYAALLALLGIGVLRGIMNGNDFGNVFFDANGYAYFALFPAVLTVFSGDVWRRRLLAVFSAGILVSVAKALAVLYFFSHRMFGVATVLYPWVRDTRVGEITIMVGDFYRVFFQSHLFALIAMFIPLYLLMYVRGRGLFPYRFKMIIALSLPMAAMLLSLSRSFWFGGFMALLMTVMLLIWSRARAETWKRLLIAGSTAVLLGTAMLFIVYMIPVPQRGADISFSSLFGSRALSFAGEAAANSRWALLPELWSAIQERPVFGSGLGTTATYTTSDPRLLATNPTGAYTTFAFEWGYHDLWVKFGLFGLSIFAWLIAVIALPFILALRDCRQCFREPDQGSLSRQKEKAVIAAAVLAGIVALLATHVFSPYLNHPLGIGLLMLIATFGIYGLPGESERGSSVSKTAPTRS